MPDISEINHIFPAISATRALLSEWVLKELTTAKNEMAQIAPVKSRWVDCFASRVKLDGACLIWTKNISRLGYGQSSFSRYGLKDNKAHRVSWILSHGEIENGLHVLHKCDVRSCVNPNHLFLGTHQDNMADMVEKGRLVMAPIRLGSANKMAKLTAAQVLEIRSLAATTTLTNKQLSERFGVGPMQISRIVRRELWRHI